MTIFQNTSKIIDLTCRGRYIDYGKSLLSSLQFHVYACTQLHARTCMCVNTCPTGGASQTTGTHILHKLHCVPDAAISCRRDCPSSPINGLYASSGSNFNASLCCLFISDILCVYFPFSNFVICSNILSRAVLKSTCK